ncbi:MAG TPA: response regulator [Tepidisphaeraceae bacterium]|nr:response regulator [Tepidisphaeraceae bacterium]
MMNLFQNLAIRWKLTLITMSVCVASLVVASTTLALRDLAYARDQIVQSHNLSADTVADNITAALSFQNSNDATEALSAFRADEDIEGAWVFTPDLKIFATYFKGPQFAPPDPRELESVGHHFTNERLEIWRPIVLHLRTIGAVVVVSNLNEVNEKWSQDLKIMAIVAASAAVVALALIMWLQRFISRPIVNLTNTAKAITSDRDYSLRAISSSKDELGTLVDCFNAMLDEIQKRDEQLQSHRDNLEDQVVLRTAELTHVNSELVVARDFAEQANRAKSAFLANMSHEIRTPMTAIIGCAEMMLDPDQNQEERAESLQIIRRNGAHLLELIDDILDLSKIEADKMTVERIDVDLLNIVTEISSLMRPRAINKGLAFKVEFIDPTPKTIKGDALRLRQVLVNLINNAIKFTIEGEIRLIVSCVVRKSPHSDLIRFDICDTGVGMNQEQMSRLFQSFTQADESMSRKFGGTGLGLNISRKLAELMGGDIRIESKPGKGSVFTVEIDCGSLRQVEMLTGVQESMLCFKTPLTPLALPTIRGRVLFVEDGEDNRRLISSHLRKAGAEIMLAENGQQAIELITRHPFDVILMDMQMPVMDGYVATRLLRQNGCTLPIIVLTAHALAEDRAKCINAGCTDYLSKPIERTVLLQKVASYIDSPPKTSREVSDGLLVVRGDLSTPSPINSKDPVMHRSEFASDPDMKELIDEYVNRLPGEVAKLHAFIRNGDLESLRQTVHQLKGAGGGYGFKQLTSLAALADESLRHGSDLETIRSQVDQISAYIREIEGYQPSLESCDVANRAIG